MGWSTPTFAAGSPGTIDNDGDVQYLTITVRNSDGKYYDFVYE